MDISPYDDRLPPVTDILQILGADPEVSAKGTSIGTAKFQPKLKSLTLIMFSNLYPLTNTRFINLGRAQFLCDLIIRAPIDICTHIFQTIRKTVSRMRLSFYSLITPKDGAILVRQRPISMVSFQMSKSHSSTEREKQNLSKIPKNESVLHATLSGHGLATHTTLRHTKTTSHHTPKLQSTSTQPKQPSSHADKLTTLVEGLHERISRLANTIYSTNNQVQMHLTTIKTQLDEI